MPAGSGSEAQLGALCSQTFHISDWHKQHFWLAAVIESKLTRQDPNTVGGKVAANRSGLSGSVRGH